MKNILKNSILGDFWTVLSSNPDSIKRVKPVISASMYKKSSVSLDFFKAMNFNSGKMALR